MKHIQLSLIFLLLIFVLPISLQASIIYVDVAATGANNGTSWQNAYTKLQDAIDASQYCDSIKVAEGNYVPKTSNNSFTLRDIKLYGGYPSLNLRNLSTQQVENLRNTTLYPTILQHRFMLSPLPTDHPIMVASSNLEGSCSVSVSDENGMLLYSYANIIDGVRFQGNTGVKISITEKGNDVKFRFSNCIFDGKDRLNRRGSFGVQVTECYNAYIRPRFYQCTFQNYSFAGFATSLPQQFAGYHIISTTFEECVFKDSKRGISLISSLPEGSAQNSTGIVTYIYRCEFKNLKSNSTRELGGSIFINGNEARNIWVYSYNNIFYDNDRVLYANIPQLRQVANFGGVPQLNAVFKFYNDTFYRNNTNTTHAAFTFYNKDQQYPDNEFAPSLQLKNCISWQNANAEGKWMTLDKGTHVEITNSLLETTINTNAIENLRANPTFDRVRTAGTIFYGQNPLFMNDNLATLNLALQPNSVCRNTGVTRGGTDFLGKPRTIEGQTDMGAYEFCPYNDTCSEADNDVQPPRKIAVTNGEELKSNEILVYPNPAQEVVNISSKEQILSIRILNIQGQVLRTVTNRNKINLNGLANGVYLLNITTKEGTSTKRFVKH
ncbi:T9SS type A sorting domain-containing protein [Bernardetia sp.]|uniref:T9SS type A sorting domain-containing protein n=1 Tax=Bernardetia sp. TaxID=1937974 RepID=UPI0025C61337|nr:T9SS type A sorting domain-containing protein [Bernardetia sp.]